MLMSTPGDATLANGVPFLKAAAVTAVRGA
jgi:hypothetical protein